MSAERQIRKMAGPAFPWHAAAIALSFIGILIPNFTPDTALAATTELIVADPRSGLAINGFDPVCYFTEKAAKFGQPTIEFPFGGVVWRFRNTGNRAAFEANPEVYMPRFGGYDPVGVARGRAVPGNPLHWTIVRDRLYLFYDADTAGQFSAAPEKFIQSAEEQWPDVRHNLAP